MSGSDSANHDEVRLRAVFIPDGENLDGTLLEGITDPVYLRVELTVDRDDDAGSDQGTGSSGS